MGSRSEEIFSYAYGVEDNGNVESDPQSEFKSENILFLAHSLSEVAQKCGKSEEEIRLVLEESKKRLFEVRAHRPRQQLDDKVLTSWNGLMISALARASSILAEEKYLKGSERAATFIQNRLYEPKNCQLYRSWRKEERKVKGIADDYAFLTQGLIDLYESSFEPRWLEWAIELAEEQNKRFFDLERGGFYMTQVQENRDLLLRVKEDSDNVEPSASSVATLNLLRLAQFTARKDFQESAENTLKLYVSQMNEQPRSLPQMMVALNFALTQPCQIIIAGDKKSAETQRLIKEVNSSFIPNKILMLLDQTPSDQILQKHLPFLQKIVPIKNKPTVYVCSNYDCELPTNDPVVLRQILDRKLSTRTSVENM